MSDSLGPRPFTLSPTDQRGAMMTVSALFIIYAIMIVGMRLSTKYRSMAVDDWLAVAATALALAQPISTIVAVENGFGAAYSLFSDHQKNTIASSLRASDIFFLLSLFASKGSVIWLCYRLFSVSRNRKSFIWKFLAASCAVWCVGSILAVNVGCTATQVVRAGDGRCSGLVARWAVVGTLDAVTELVLVGFSILEVIPLQMSFSRKVQASVCFAFRVPIIIFIVLHLKFLADFNSASNPSVVLTKVQIFRHCEMLLALLTASIPALSQYLRKFNTQDATQFGFNPSRYGNGSGGGSGGGSAGAGSRGRSLQFKSLSKSGKKTKASVNNSKNWTNSNSDEFNNKEEASASYKALIETQSSKVQDGGGSDVSHEDTFFHARHNSQDHIIHKNVMFEVRHEA